MPAVPAVTALDVVAVCVVIALNVAFAWVVLRFAWRQLIRAEEQEGPGEDRRFADRLYQAPILPSDPTPAPTEAELRPERPPRSAAGDAASDTGDADSRGVTRQPGRRPGGGEGARPGSPARAGADPAAPHRRSSSPPRARRLRPQRRSRRGG